MFMKKLALRNVTTKLLPVLVLAITASLLIGHYFHVVDMKEKAFEELVLKDQELARMKFKRHFEPIVSNLSIVGRWVQSESPDLSNVVALNSRFMPILQEIPQISSMLVADSKGREYMLLRTESGWLTRLSDVDRLDGQSLWNRWTKSNDAVESWQEKLDYDPRTRPWFRVAVDSGQEQTAAWTRPYAFHTTHQLGITVASQWPHSSREGEYQVVAFDVLLTEISSQTMKIASRTGGNAFILGADGLVLGVPAAPQFEDPATLEASVLTPAHKFPVSMVGDAYAEWDARGRAAGEPFIFTSGDAAWWASFWHYALGKQSLWLAVAVPESDLVHRIGGQGYAVTVTIGSIGLMLFIAAVLVAKRYRGEISNDNQASDSVARLFAQIDEPNADLTTQINSLILEGENERLEFKSSVRWNFKAGRKGKEMELAWLKTVVAYLNTQGGIILLGVDDAGEVLGLDKDGFANDDKALRHIENLIAQHIGPTYFPYIHTRLQSVANKKVLMIICKAAPTPAFLKHDKGEDFYIRTGPASRSLSPSEVLDYIDATKKS
ncbi:MAG: ATP-binding protein [Gammaproteobacteria bacterium]|nr:MAG: ATP-binding protein [Gammaproteobacteria bacterium]